MSFLKNLLIMLMLVSIPALEAAPKPDVKQATETKFKFKGALGTMMRFLGGNRPSRSVKYLRGNVLRTDELDKKNKVKKSTIIDLDKELFITIDRKKKRYTQWTFAEWQEMMKSAFAGLKETSAEEGEEKTPESEEKPDVDISFKLDMDTPGEHKKIAGYDAEKIILKLTVEAKAQEQAAGQGNEAEADQGGLIVTSTQWIAKSVPGYGEFKSFNKRLAEKLGIVPGKMGLNELIRKVTASNPQLAAAMKKIEDESEKLDGVALEVHTVFESWGKAKSQEGEMQGEEEEVKIPKSVGGLFKGFGKKLAKSRAKKKEDSSKPHVLLETSTKTTSYETQPLNADLFSIPAKYKMEKK